MQVELESVARLRFDDGSPVRAASAVVPLADGFLVVQDDATQAAWVRPESTQPVRLLPPVEGLDTFEESAGTKHLKPDLEAACPVSVGDREAVLLMGSGSSGRRMRWCLVEARDGAVHTRTADMAPLYAVVARTLDVPLELLNLEGACVVGDVLRWFHRGLPSAGSLPASVDLDLAEVFAAFQGGTTPEVGSPRVYDLGEAGGVGLAITDAVVLPDGAILVSGAAEDAPNPRDDGPVVGSALVRISGDVLTDVTPLPLVDGRVSKVEGLMLLGVDGPQVRLLAVVDVDDPGTPSLALYLGVLR